MVVRKNMLLLLSLGLLLALPAQAASAPVKKDRFYYEKKGEMIWEVHTNRKLIALTFDDGPDPAQTSQILDLLRLYDAKCTFFMVGRKVALHPEMAMRVVAEGHEAANHTYNHRYFRLPSSEAIVRREIESTENEILQATGRHSALFRPPGGNYDETIVKVVRQMGLVPVMWSWHQDTRDWSRPGVSKIMNKVLNNARNGDIVLFHDFVQGNTQTIEALKTILPELKRRGYRMVTVSELIRTSAADAREQEKLAKQKE